MKFRDFYNETVQGAIDQLLLEYTIAQFRTEIPSKLNKKFYKERLQKGNDSSFFVDANWVNDKILVIFDVTPTYDKKVKVITKKGIIKNGSKYKLEVQFIDVNKYIGKRIDFLKLEKKEQVKQFRALIKNCEVKLFSSDLSWFWQGTWENAEKGDYSIYPFPKNRQYGDDIWTNRHGGAPYVTKHIISCLRNISFLAPDIAKKIREKYSNK